LVFEADNHKEDTTGFENENFLKTWCLFCVFMHFVSVIYLFLIFKQQVIRRSH